MITKQFVVTCLVILLFPLATIATGTQVQEQSKKNEQTNESQAPRSMQKIPAGSRVYIAPMDGFETYLREAIIKKKVPIQLVDQREKAEYEITGVAESKKAGAAKKIIMGSWHSEEDASIKVSNLKTGEIAYAYSVHKQDSAHGKKSTAEACAKHLKDEGVASK